MRHGRKALSFIFGVDSEGHPPGSKGRGSYGELTITMQAHRQALLAIS